MGYGHRESPWEGLCAASAAALGRISDVEWAVVRIDPAELWAGQAACTHSQGRRVLGWAGLAAPRGISQPLLGSCSCH